MGQAGSQESSFRAACVQYRRRTCALMCSKQFRRTVVGESLYWLINCDAYCLLFPYGWVVKLWTAADVMRDCVSPKVDSVSTFPPVQGFFSTPRFKMNGITRVFTAPPYLV